MSNNNKFLGENSELCSSKFKFGNLNILTVTLNFLNEFKDSFFYAFFIQFVLVTYMYYRVGHGKYWKVLFYAAIVGQVGALCEHLTISIVCNKNYYGEGLYIVFFVQEIFWTLCEFAIPYLNLIKLSAISQDKYVKMLKYLLIVLFLFFGTTRGYIGWLRYEAHELSTNEVYKFHSMAFGTMAIADLCCTLLILRKIAHNIKRERNKGNTTFSISTYIRRSSYTVLLLVDMCSIVLAVMSFLYDRPDGKPEEKNKGFAVVPFHTIKSNYVLILAVDALIFKISASGRSANSSNSNYASRSGNINNTNNNTAGIIGGGSTSNLDNATTLTNNGNGNMSALERSINSNINGNPVTSTNYIMNISNERNGGNGNNNMGGTAKAIPLSSVINGTLGYISQPYSPTNYTATSVINGNAKSGVESVYSANSFNNSMQSPKSSMNPSIISSSSSPYQTEKKRKKSNVSNINNNFAGNVLLNHHINKIDEEKVMIRGGMMDEDDDDDSSIDQSTPNTKYLSTAHSDNSMSYLYENKKSRKNKIINSSNYFVSH